MNIDEISKVLQGWPLLVFSAFAGIGYGVMKVVSWRRERKASLKEAEQYITRDETAKWHSTLQDDKNRLIEELRKRDQDLRQANEDKAELYERLIESTTKNEVLDAMLKAARDGYLAVSKSKPPLPSTTDSAEKSTSMQKSLPKPPLRRPPIPKSRKN